MAKRLENPAKTSVLKQTSLQLNTGIKNQNKIKIGPAVEYDKTFKPGKPTEQEKKQFLHDINFNSKKIIHNPTTRCTKDGFIYMGKEYKFDELPQPSAENAKEIKAKDNVLVFEKNSYYKYKSKDGSMKLIDTSNDTLGNTSVDQLSGKYDEETERYGLFFDLFAHNSVGHGLYFSKQEERKMLEEVGIKPGFFTVKVGDKEGTYFLSKYDEIAPTIPKKQYDGGYRSLTKEGNSFFRYKVGGNVKIDGKDYTLDENKNVDIPYGTDFYHIIKADKSQYEDFYIQNPQY